MSIIGVDPGKHGAFALLADDGELLDVADMPAVGKHVSPVMVTDILWDWVNLEGGKTVIIEDVSASPQMGVVSAFSFGRSKGIIEGVAAALHCRVGYVTPALWKRNMKLTKDKNAARSMAIERWPDHREFFKRVKDDGRAEAALIGLWQVRHGQA